MEDNFLFLLYIYIYIYIYISLLYRSTFVLHVFFLFFFSKWEKLTSDEQREYHITASSQLCYDCAQTGDVGFRKFYGHSCLNHGYHLGEAAKFIRACPICKTTCDSVTKAIYHNATAHGHFYQIKCALIDCGRTYYNDTAHNLHEFKYHGGFTLFDKKLKDQYGPRPTNFKI